MNRNLGISINNFPKENKIILEAKPTAEAKNKFYFMITLDRQIHDKIFKIHPPVILENTLPLPLDIKVNFILFLNINGLNPQI